MRILITVDPEIEVLSKGYGGIERIVDILVKEYTRIGHSVTLCANKNSTANCKLVVWNGKKVITNWI